MDTNEYHSINGTIFPYSVSPLVFTMKNYTGVTHDNDFGRASERVKPLVTNEIIASDSRASSSE
jgi:hypothetical protein